MHKSFVFGALDDDQAEEVVHATGCAGRIPSERVSIALPTSQQFHISSPAKVQALESRNFPAGHVAIRAGADVAENDDGVSRRREPRDALPQRVQKFMR